MIALPAARAEQTRLGGKYLLRRKIARGGMGDIWVALNESTRADVAIKVLRPTFASADDVALRFRHEAHIASVLAHRNIVRVFDLLEEGDGSLALVMELLRGESLATHLKQRGSLSHAETIAIMLPILSALSHAHGEGIVHRDIKPGNIVLSVEPDGLVAPKLLDFGIAKTAKADAHTKVGQVLGTPRYMSPEQIRAVPLDGRSDLFSLTVVCIELLTGKSPFDAGAASASLAAVIETEIDPDPRIDPRLWLVLKRGLAKLPYERFTSATEYADALRSAMPELEGEMAATLRRAPPESGYHHVAFADPEGEPSRGDGSTAPAANHASEPNDGMSASLPAIPLPTSNGRKIAIAFGLGLATLASIFAVRLATTSPAGREPSSTATSVPETAPQIPSAATSAREISIDDTPATPIKRARSTQKATRPVPAGATSFKKKGIATTPDF